MCGYSSTGKKSGLNPAVLVTFIAGLLFSRFERANNLGASRSAADREVTVIFQFNN
jgi:hypothetical protein